MLLTIERPTSGELLLSVGQEVDFNTPFIKTGSKEEIRIPLSNILKKPEKQIFQFLKKFVGDSVQKGDVIAEAKGMFGTKTYKSPHNGTLKEINHNDGSIVLETEGDDKTDVTCFFTGTVSEITDDEIKVKVKQAHEMEIHEATASFGGEIFWYEGNAPMEIHFDKADQKVVFSVALTPFEQVKLETLGVDGYVTIHPLPEDTEVPSGKLKSTDDWGSLKEHHHFPYCIVDGKNNKMYLYTT